KEEVDTYKRKDPLLRARADLIDGQVSEEELLKIEEEIEEIVNESVEFADASPEPPPAALWQHVYAD
ncbi:MAG TPA: thiamine pyrophosphate-dependent enzyme, partial [Leptospiraceae bacterium]|nr:thiamine pyrophosphate-dependent enzyme [Leptospiraceae bacterium]